MAKANFPFEQNEDLWLCTYVCACDQNTVLRSQHLDYLYSFLLSWEIRFSLTSDIGWFDLLNEVDATPGQKVYLWKHEQGQDGDQFVQLPHISKRYLVNLGKKVLLPHQI